MLKHFYSMHISSTFTVALVLKIPNSLFLKGPPPVHVLPLQLGCLMLLLYAEFERKQPMRT